jgi:hypothetical protein
VHCNGKYSRVDVVDMVKVDSNLKVLISQRCILNVFSAHISSIYSHFLLATLLSFGDALVLAASEKIAGSVITSATSNE